MIHLKNVIQNVDLDNVVWRENVNAFDTETMEVADCESNVRILNYCVVS